MEVPVANLSGVVTSAVRAAIRLAAEKLPTEVTRDAALEATKVWTAWFLHHLWAWLVAARAGAAENLPVAADAARRAVGAAVEASGPWLEIASKLLDGLHGRVISAIADVAAYAVALKGRASGYVLLLALALLPVVAVWALTRCRTCRTMKGPGLGGARIPRAAFEANPRSYFAARRSERKARHGASDGAGLKLLVAAVVFAYVAYVAAKTIY